MGEVYNKKVLAGSKGQRTYRGEQLEQIAFPLGGLGAGCIHLGGSGNLQDFCLFHQPNFGHSPMTFAAVHCQERGRKGGILRILEGPVQKPLIYDQGRFGNGGLSSGHEGLPHMESAAFKGEFPFANVRLKDRDLLLEVRLEAFSPFVPGDELASGLPAAFLRYTLRNRSSRALKVQFSFNVQYPAKPPDLSGHRVRYRQAPGVAGIFFDSELPEDAPHKASVAVVSPRPGLQANCTWFRGGWFDTLTMLTNALAAGGLQHRAESQPLKGSGQGAIVGLRFGATVFWNLELRRGEEVEIPLVYAWHVPNSELKAGTLPATEADTCCDADEDTCCGPSTYSPWYTTQFADAWAAGMYAASEWAGLEERSRRFHRRFFSTSLPSYVLDAVSANLAILKSPTVLRQEDGMLWCWEGCSYGNGCCHGSCTHVWNYAQAIPHLFPALERTLRDQELKWSMDEAGHVTFRSVLPTGQTTHTHHAAADGQLGGIMKLYRDWQISGERAWLEERYPLVRRSLEYCIRTWDPDEKGALFEPHHNTYDIEFWGADGMCTSFYLGALQAMGAMAEHLGRAEDAARYRSLADKGRAYCDEHLWNGEFYIQKVQVEGLRVAAELDKWIGGYSEEAKAVFKREGPKYQYGAGCLSDGVIGEWYAAMLGLPEALTRKRTKKHLASIFKYNFRNSLRGHANPQRPGYALNDEPGLLLCSWPKGGKPSLPFVYSDEVWTGIEYQVASHLIYAGLVAEGLSLVHAVRQRYEGRVRNPWNEYECGSYYARALSSYAVLLALSGFRYRAPERRLELAPCWQEKQGRFFFAAERAWGSVHYEDRGGKRQVRVEVEVGRLEVAELVWDGARPQHRSLREPAVVAPGQPLKVALG
jgi:uncharacterized protein (DUF608 family)